MSGESSRGFYRGAAVRGNEIGGEPPVRVAFTASLMTSGSDVVLSTDACLRPTSSGPPGHGNLDSSGCSGEYARVCAES